MYNFLAESLQGPAERDKILTFSSVSRPNSLLRIVLVTFTLLISMKLGVLHKNRFVENFLINGKNPNFSSAFLWILGAACVTGFAAHMIQDIRDAFCLVEDIMPTICFHWCRW